MGLMGKKSLRVIMFILCLFPSLSLAGGTLAGNGQAGGGSEQAIVLAGARIRDFYKNCLQFVQCGKKEPTKSRIETLLNKYDLPQIGVFKFAVPDNDVNLLKTTPYYRSKDHFVLNRQFLYDENDRPLTVSQAIGHLTRLFFDDSGIESFEMSEESVSDLIKFSETQGEQISVGKDEIKLKPEKWIRLKSFYNALVIEAPGEFLRLGCPNGDIDQCSFQAEDFFSAENKFAQFSLTEEKLVNKEIHFRMEGLYYLKGFFPQVFVIEAIYKDGEAKEVLFQGRELELPSSETQTPPQDSPDN